MTLKDLRNIEVQNAGNMVNAVCSAHGYTLELVEGDKGDNGDNCRVRHDLKVIYLEVWCLEDSLGAVAVSMHECGHIAQCNDLLYKIHVACPYLRWLTLILLEIDANDVACRFNPCRTEVINMRKVRAYYRTNVLKYVRNLWY